MLQLKRTLKKMPRTLREERRDYEKADIGLPVGLLARKPKIPSVNFSPQLVTTHLEWSPAPLVFPLQKMLPMSSCTRRVLAGFNDVTSHWAGRWQEGHSSIEGSTWCYFGSGLHSAMFCHQIYCNRMSISWFHRFGNWN